MRHGRLSSCLQTRAVHLKAAYKVDTDFFIIDLMMFLGRRGAPRVIYSDNHIKLFVSQLK